jgi:murein endopeptidase
LRWLYLGLIFLKMATTKEHVSAIKMNSELGLVHKNVIKMVTKQLHKAEHTTLIQFVVCYSSIQKVID